MPDHEPPTDDVEGHRQLTPDQAQKRAEAARREKERRDSEEAGATDRDA
jgi:hypothetical protein